MSDIAEIREVIELYNEIENLHENKEKELIGCLRNSKGQAEQAKKQIIEAYMKLVVKEAKTLNNRQINERLMELISEGSLRLIELVDTIHEKYDPEYNLAGYLRSRVRFAMLDHIQSEKGFNSTDKKIDGYIRQLEKQYAKENRDWPYGSEDEEKNLIQQEVNRRDSTISEESIQAYINKRYNTFSMDKSVDEEDAEDSLGDLLQDDNKNTEAEAIKAVNYSGIRELLKEKCSSEEEKVVLRDYDYLVENDCMDHMKKGKHLGKIAAEYITGYSVMTTKEQQAVRDEIRKSYKIILAVLKAEEKADKPDDQMHRITRMEKAVLSKNSDVLSVDYYLDKFTDELEQIIDELDYEELKSTFDRVLDGKEEISLNTLFENGYFDNNLRPLRNEIIAIALYKELEQKDVNKLLKAAGCGPLYLRNYKDFVIRYLLGKGRNRGTGNESIIDRYVSLCEQAEKELKDNVDETVIFNQGTKVEEGKKNDTISAGQIKAYLEAKNANEKTENGLIETMTSRANNGLMEIMKNENGTDEDFIRWIRDNAVLFTGMRERTYRIILQMLVEYTDWYQDNKCFTKNVIHSNDNINFTGLFTQLKEFAGDYSKTTANERTNAARWLGIMTKYYTARHGKKSKKDEYESFSFDVNRDMFLSLAVFFSQVKDNSEDRIKYVNHNLDAAGFDKLNNDIKTDSYLESVITKGRKDGDLSDELIIGYELYKKGLFFGQGIGENRRRSQYTHL